MGPDILAIGASAGGVRAICALLSRLPANLPASVLIVLHRPVNMESHLPAVLARATSLRVRLATEADKLEHGTCLVSPPNCHLTVTPGPRIHLLPDGFYRSHNVDALFTSLAGCVGSRTIGVILSGALKDGALGLKSIKDAGGLALVQDPIEAEFSEMPSSAIRYDGPIDFVAPIAELAEFICRQTGCLPVEISAA